MYYYKDWTCLSTLTNELIANLDGQCGAWASFLIDLLKIHNVFHSSVNNDYVKVDPEVFSIFSSIEEPLGFLVKKWTFTNGAYTGSVDPDYPYVMIPHHTIPFYDGNQINTIYTEAKDEPGIDAQGVNANPKSIFENHQFTNITDRYLDPAYGVEYSSLLSMKLNAISGFYRTVLGEIDETVVDIDLNGDGIKEVNASVFVCCKR